MSEELLQMIKFDERGLVAAVIQDAEDGAVLMVGYMNRDAVMKTIETGRVHFWSRSRQKMWLKGETSGHVQTLRELRIDCDGDCLLVKAEQQVAACHTGYRSCFYRKWTPGGWLEQGEKVFDPKKVYHP